MDIVCNEKRAQGSNNPIINALDLTRYLGSTSLSLALGLGVLGGAALGLGSSAVKARNPEYIALKRRKKFYDSKIDEMRNEEWLSNIMSLRRKLETGKLSDEERDKLESEYIKLINE